MPEPITLAFLAGAKLFAMHAGHAAVVQGAATVTAGGVTGAGVAHTAMLLTAGVAAGTILYSICRSLDKLRNAGVLSTREAEQMKEKARSLDEKQQMEMKEDVDALARKWGV